MAERIGTPLQGPVRIKSTLTPKPIAYSNEIAGGPWNVSTVAQMYAIESFYRKDETGAALWGATCYVHSDPVSANNGRYELVRGLVDNNIDNNDNWQKVSSGTGGSSYTAAQIRDLYESNPDRNAFTDAEKMKLAGISGMSASQIKTSYESNANTNAFTDSEKAKLALQSGSNSGDETNQSILGKLLNNPDVNIVTDLEKQKVINIQGVNTGDETPEAVLNKLLSNENVEQYTTAEKDKLAGLEDAKWKGSYTNLVSLQSAYPVGEPGWEADVDAGVGDPVQRYIWDESDQQWEAQVGTSTSETAASVKAKYESNPNTNEYSDGDKAKVAAISGTNTGDETPASVKTKLLQNPDTNNFGDAQLAKLNGIEVGATADMTAAEIAAAYHTVSNEYTDGDLAKVGNLPANTIQELEGKVDKEVGKSLIADSAIAKLAGIEAGATSDMTPAEIAAAYHTVANQYTTAEKTKVANLPADTNNELALKQAAIDAITPENWAGMGLTANGGKIDLGGTITGSEEIFLVAQNGAIINYVAQGANAKIQYIIASGGEVVYKFNDGTGAVKIGDSGVLESTFTDTLFRVNNAYNAGFADFQAGMYNFYSKILGVSSNANISSIIQEIISKNYNDGTTEPEFKIVNTVTYIDTTPTKTTGIDFTPDGPVLIGEPSPAANALVRRSDLGSGGTSLTKATQSQAEAGTDDAAYMTALKVLQSMAQRVGIGLTYNPTTKKINLGGSAENTTFFISTFMPVPVGHPNPYWNESWRIRIENNAGVNAKSSRIEYTYNSFDSVTYPEGITISNNVRAGKTGIVIGAESGGLKIYIGDKDSEDGAVTNHDSHIVDNRDVKKGLEYYADYSAFFTERSLIDRDYVDKTQIGTAITASKTFALDAGANKITAVNSASAVVLTIPADATTNFPIGSTINIRRKGAGTVEIVGAVGVTIEGIADSNGDFKIPQYGVASMYKESANLWVIYGALES